MAHGKVIVPNILVAHRRPVARRHPAAHHGPIVYRNFALHRFQTNFSFS
ncbi:hypothetical protein [Collinsella intestinalis]|nr:hypothetical protein [Collinsella intestinalis]